MKKNILIVCTCFLITIALVTGFVAYLVSIIPKDIADFDDSRLIRPVVTIENDQNAFTYYQQAAKALFLTDDKKKVEEICNSENWDDSFAAMLISSNEQCFAYIREGNNCSQCIVPRVTSYDTLLPYIQKWLKTSRLLVIKSKYHLRHKELPQAIGTISDHLKFASLCESDAGNMILYLVAGNMRESALHQTRRIIRSGLLNNPQLSQLETILQQTAPSTDGMVLALQSEYECFANLLSGIADGTINLDEDSSSMLPKSIKLKAQNLFFHPNRSKRDMGQLYDEVIAQITNCYAEIHLTDTESFVLEKKREIDDAVGFAKLKVPNTGGTILYALLFPAYKNFIKKRCSNQTAHRATFIMSALYRFQNSRGSFPKQLNKLVPDFIDSIPIDPFDGKTMRYSEAKGLVYSVGEDLIDSGGSTNRIPLSDWSDKNKTEDITFEIR
jgi:hypothetical protein